MRRSDPRCAQVRQYGFPCIECKAQRGEGVVGALRFAGVVLLSASCRDLSFALVRDELRRVVDVAALDRRIVQLARAAFVLGHLDVERIADAQPVLATVASAIEFGTRRAKVQRVTRLRGARIGASSAHTSVE